MKKQVVAILLITCMLLTACSSGNGSALDPKNPVTLTLWHYYVGDNQQMLEQIINDFNQTVGIERGVIISPVAAGSIANLEESITNSATGKINSADMPDIFSSYADKATELDALGVLADLSPYFTEDELSQYVEGFISEGYLNDERLLLLPIVKSTELLYISNTDWEPFAQSEGISAEALSTWEGVYDVARRYYAWTDAKTPNVAHDGMALIGLDSVANYIITGAKQLGVDVIDASTKGANLDESALRPLFDVYVEAMAMGYFGAYGKFRSDDMKSGLLIGYVGSSSSAAYFPTWIEIDGKPSPIELLALGIPTFEGGSPHSIQQGAGMCVTKSDDPARVEGAALFLKWFTSAENNLGFAMTTGYLPVQSNAFSSDELEPMLQELKESGESGANVAAVYEITLHQVMETSTYAAKPFEGSYNIRGTLQSTLLAAAADAKATADSLFEQGMSEQEVLDSLDLDARFDGWLESVRAELSEAGVAHS